MNFQQLSNIPLTQGLSADKFSAEIGSLRSRFSSLRPAQEFLDVKRISKPENFGEIQSRVAFNLGHYQGNYLAIVGMLSIYTLLTNLLLLFVLLFVIAGSFGIGKLHGESLTIPGLGSYKPSQLYTGLACVAVPLGFLASPISSLLWLIGASAVTVLSHASFFEKPIENVFEETV